MKNYECETCLKRKTEYCPNSSECYETKDKPYWQNSTLLLEENQALKKQIVIMEKYFELIADLGYDYDGFNTVESLKELISELVRFANLGRAANVTECIYQGTDFKLNILRERIGEIK